MREGPSGRDCSGWARRADCPPAFMLSPGRLRPGPGFALHSIAATPLQTGANAVFRALNPLLFLMPRVFSSSRPAPHIPESQVDCGGRSEICGPRFPAANCPFRKRSAGQKGKARGRKPIVTRVGQHASCTRPFVDAVLYHCRADFPWRDLPRRFGAFRVIHLRHITLRQRDSAAHAAFAAGAAHPGGRWRSRCSCRRGGC